MKNLYTISPLGCATYLHSQGKKSGFDNNASQCKLIQVNSVNKRELY